jgi:hypothetical protein
MAFWVVVLADVVEFFCGYYEEDFESCRSAQTHYILKESWYAAGCRMGEK